ncbi:MAG TPA: DMT family transporter [Candidatus Eisenbacteria bacterium]|jgi:drug/metabolite transporter (DMT)-like permease|nr:DMT family transporter [Candidatus Eisenbacteria bacterium]
MNQRTRAVYLMLGVVLIWGGNVSGMKAALTQLTPQAFNALRFPLGAFVLGLFLWKLEPDPLPKRHEWREIVTLGIIAHPIYQACFLNGLALTSASHTAILVSTSPVWVALADHFVSHERLPAMAWTGILISLSGVVVLVAARGGHGAPSSLLGDGLVVVSSMLWTTYVIRSRPLFRTRSPLWVTTWALFVGAPLIVLLGVRDVWRTDLLALTSTTWGALVFAGLFALATAYSWWAIGVKNLGAARAASFSNLIPVVALLVAWLWLHESLPALSWAGAILACAGVWLTTTSRSAVAPQTPELGE